VSIMGQDYTCSVCGHRSQFHSEGEELETTHGYEESVKCPACNDVIRHKRGNGRQQGQSHLHYGPCLKCGSQTELFPLQGGTYSTLCSECARAYSSSSY
jgi:uncharacterized C2H2 Zn-finger protein